MKKTVPTLFALTLAATPVLAGGSSSGPYMVYKGIMMLLSVFVCSIIFWWTYLWMVQDKGVLKKAAQPAVVSAPVAAKKSKRKK